MNVAGSEVNTPVEPAIFPGGALSITIEALLDPDDCTILFVVRAFDVPAGKLIALWSSSPVGFDGFGREQRRALTEFNELVELHTGPF